MALIEPKKLIVDGIDMSNKVKSVEIEFSSGSLPEVELHLVVGSVTVDNGNITVVTIHG
jgi:hypothetical protein